MSSRATLQNYFLTGSIPTQTQFADLINSILNLTDDSYTTVPGLTTALSAKQGTISLTTSGTSGAATLVGNTLNIPQYSGGGGGGTWGTITGTLSSQTDLNTVLSSKQGTITLTTSGTSGAASLVGNTLNIPQYAFGFWGGITGTLSSQTDLQTALNAKQGTLTLTTTGSSGAATLVGNTLNIPSYSGGGSSTWGSITGTLSSQTDLNTALSGKQATITLTTTGSSGAATLISNTLNIPSYSGGAWGSITGTLSNQTDLKNNFLTKINVPSSSGSGSLYSTGLITDFNFANPSSLVISGGKVTQITDAVGSIVNSQATAGNQPVYTANGGPGGLGYATFAGNQQLNGGALTTSTTFTMFIVRRVVSTTTAMIPFYVGSAASDGYGWIDFFNDPGWGAVNGYYGGGYFSGLSSEQARGFFSVSSKWEVVAVTHNASGNFVYNSNGTKYAALTAGAPVTPSASNFIGSGLNGATFPFTGDIQRILLFNTGLTDAQIFQNIQYLSSNIILPANLNIDGDSRLSPSYTVSTQTQLNLLSLNIPSYLSLTAVPGYTTANIISDLSTKVTLNVNPNTTNLFVLMTGHNDVATGSTAAQVWTAIQSICSTVRAAGYKILLCTDLYNSNTYSSGVGASWNATKDIYNANIRSAVPAVADYVIDINALTHGSPTNMANTTYSADGVHPATALANDMTALIQASIQTYLTANTNSLGALGASVGSIPYFLTASPNFSYTVPNITTTPKYLVQTGTSGVANSPTFSNVTLVNGNVDFSGSTGTGQAVYLLTNSSLTIGNNSSLTIGLNQTIQFLSGSSSSLSINIPTTSAITLPASGTLVSSVTTANGISATNTAGALSFTLGAITPTSVNGNTITAGTGTLTIANSLITSGAFAITLTATAVSNATLPAGSGTLVYLAGTNTWTGVNTMILKNFLAKATVTAVNASATLTAAQVQSGITTSSTVAVAFTMPTATLLATQVSAAQGTTMIFTIDNSASTASGAITLTLGTGMTSGLTAGLIIAIGKTATYVIYFTSTTACVMSQIC